MEDIFHESIGKDLTELAQDSYTRRGLEGAHFKVLSRIDRCLCDLDTLSLLDSNIKAGVEWPLASGHDPSDHVPIFVAFQAPPIWPPQPSIPLWIARLPRFATEVQLALDDMPADHSSWHSAHRGIEMAKDAMYTAASELRDASARLGASTIADKLYWSTMALRAHRRGDFTAAEKFCRIVPELLLAISPDGHGIDFQVIVEMVQVFSMSDLVAQAQEVEEDPSTPPEVKARSTAKIRRQSEAWGRTRRRLTLSALLGPGGLPILDDSVAATTLCDTWSPMFGKTEFDEAGASRLLTHAAPPLTISPLPLSIDEFSDMLSRTGNSAAGPDGIAYAAWRHAPAPCISALFELYLHIFNGGMPPPDFNSTIMVFIPKPAGDPLENLCTRAPGALRPISLANTDNKIIALAFARPLGEVAAKWCSADQFGFIAGRSIWDAVMLFEAAALHLSRRDPDAGLLFIDFRRLFHRSCTPGSTWRCSPPASRSASLLRLCYYILM
jgi:hypothetical protein